MSAPFPEPTARDPFASVFAPQQLLRIPERDTHIPTFYIPHENPGAIRVVEGNLAVLSPPGASHAKPFTVADIAPERRWAVNPNGSLLDQHQFESKLDLLIDEHFEKLYGKSFQGGKHREYKPAVRDYVTYGVDPSNPAKLRRIHYDPLANRGRKPQVFYDKDGEKIEGDERMSILIAAYQNPKLKPRMKPWEVAEVETMLKVRTEELVASVQNISEQADGTLGEEKPGRKMVATQMVCGDLVYPMHRKRHLASCDICSALPEAPAEGTE